MRTITNNNADNNSAETPKRGAAPSTPPGKNPPKSAPISSSKWRRFLVTPLPHPILLFIIRRRELPPVSRSKQSESESAGAWASGSEVEVRGIVVKNWVSGEVENSSVLLHFSAFLSLAMLFFFSCSTSFLLFYSGFKILITFFYLLLFLFLLSCYYHVSLLLS